MTTAIMTPQRLSAGSFSLTGSSTTGSGYGSVTEYVIKGTFSSKTTASGTLTIVRRDVSYYCSGGVINVSWSATK